jgi:NRPS condensation-like uncharacterized protein
MKVIQIEAKNRKIQSRYQISGKTTLNDVALILLELERMKQKIMEESENYEPLMEMIE